MHLVHVFAVLAVFGVYIGFHGNDAASVLQCAPCFGVTCMNEPTNCETDKIPCGCCKACVRKEGEMCEAFAPRCATGLMCLTPGGIFHGRPEWHQQFLKGVCVKNPDNM